MNYMPPENDQITYAAFLRGINVGGHTLIKMEDLRAEIGSLGFQNVKTILASGNVLFEAPPENTTKLSQSIAHKLRERLGREITVIVRTMGDIRALDARQPFKNIKITPETRQFVTFISGNVEHQNTSGSSMPEDLQILSNYDGIVCSVLYEKPGVDTVKLMGALEKQFGKNVTTRNWNTISRILKISK
jgi:uncharacterized protein (DUF1697 family)